MFLCWISTGYSYLFSNSPSHNIFNYSELSNALWYIVLGYLKNFRTQLEVSPRPPIPNHKKGIVGGIYHSKYLNVPLSVDTSSFITLYQGKTNGALNIENGERIWIVTQNQMVSQQLSCYTHFCKFVFQQKQSFCRLEKKLGMANEKPG